MMRNDETAFECWERYDLPMAGASDNTLISVAETLWSLEELICDLEQEKQGLIDQLSRSQERLQSA